MKLLSTLLLLSSLSPLLAQNDKQKDLDKALNTLNESFAKRNFGLLAPLLDESYSVGEFKRPKADKIVPQLLAQGPAIVGFEIKNREFKSDKIIVHIEYETEGHLFGTNTSVSKCILTTSNKFVSIEYLDNMLAGAERKTSH